MTEPARVPAAAAAARESELLRDVRRGFAAGQKVLPPKYFYDERGSRLFAEITRLDEYYPTRTERALLEAHAGSIVGECGASALVELGAGNADKTRTLLRALPEGSRYVPVDISADFLHDSAEALRREFPALRIEPRVADMTRLPPDLRPAIDRPVLFALLGSTLGNFTETEASALLTALRQRLRAGDALLLGADLVKDPAVLEAAYNDARGVTAEFNLNVLRVLNRELGAHFDPRLFRHIAFFDAARSRIEMHLLATRAHAVHVPGIGAIPFARGETIRTEISCKYTRASLDGLLAAAGLRLQGWRTDERGWYALVDARARAAVLPQASGAPLSDARSAARTRLPG